MGGGPPDAVGDGAAGDGAPGSSGDASGDVLAGALADLVDVLADEDPAGLDLAGQSGRLRAVGRLIDRLEAGRVRLLGAADRSGALSQDGAAAVNAYMHQDPPDTPSELRRSVQQRRADALVEIANAALGCADAPQVAGVKPRVVVRTDPPPRIVDHHVRTLLHTAANRTAPGHGGIGDTTGDTGYTHRDRRSRRDDTSPTTTGETRATYQPDRAPPARDSKRQPGRRTAATPAPGIRR